MTSVLVVDDQPDLRYLLRVVLDLAGMTVDEAEGGRMALERLAADPLPDVVVLDVQMPDVDGWETLERIRGTPRTAGLPVLLCTVKAAAADLVRGWELGCDGYVTKPFENHAFVDAVRQCVGLSAEERAAVRVKGLGEARRLLELELR